MIRMAVILTVSGLVLAAASAQAQNPPAENPAAESAPAESKPAESKPAESNPAESKLTESKPAESKPAENKAAESSPADGAESRYTFSRVQDGYVRLDNRTGQVSFCSKRTVGWACQLVPEDRTAFESEIARLQDENAALKKDMLTRGLALPGGIKSDPPLAQGSDRTFKLPNDPNIERMREFVEKLWRRLVDLIVNLQKEALKKS
jgi:uncharacterized low-complexity protein